MTRNKKLIVLLSAILILIDQISKYIIRTRGGFYICNKGVAFGINLPEIIFFTFFIFLLLFLPIIPKLKFQISNQSQSSKSKNFFICPPSGEARIWDLICHLDFGIWIYLILAGGVSNLIDRICFGCVIDFIDLKFWPVFNLADIYITMGGIILIIFYVFKGSFRRDHRA
jgi:lipoprotein signal peptidase